MNAFLFYIHLLIHRITALYRIKSDPFIRSFKRHVLDDSSYHPDYLTIENKRSRLLQNHSPLLANNLGAGSTKPRQWTLGEKIRVASVSPKYGRLLYRLSAWYKPSQVIELGTAAGISTLYLASGYRNAEVITVEGNSQFAELAALNFREAGMKNVILLLGTFGEFIPRLSRNMAPDSLIFIDGNHTAEAVLQYYSDFTGHSGKNPILIFDDINWSPDMRSAWQMICKQSSTGMIIDLFFMGIYFDNSQSPLRFLRINY